MKLYDTTQEQTSDNTACEPSLSSSGQMLDSSLPSPRSASFSYRFKNWWYYHKWYVICGGILLCILINVVGSALGLWEKKPDFRIAYVGSTPLPEDTVAALEQGFAQLAGDFNQDKEAIVQINQYITGVPENDPEVAVSSYSSEIRLMADISACESYFFLTDDPEALQQNFQILAEPDGSCPDETDYSAEGKTVLWSDCPALSGMNLGSYTIIMPESETTGDSQELLSGLHFGRRCFYSEKDVDSIGQYDELWNTITGTIDVQKGHR